jgi:hypothetical protein
MTFPPFLQVLSSKTPKIEHFLGAKVLPLNLLEDTLSGCYMLYHPHWPSPTANQDDGGDDLISALDDNLRVLILRLAHLDVTELVHTSMPSKQWHDMWRRFPILDFWGVATARLGRRRPTVHRHRQ